MENKYKTSQRTAIIEFLADNAEKFVNAEDIKKYLDSKNYNVGLTTIYRQLNSLEKDSKVRIEIKDHTKYYQYIKDECEDHFHLKCKNCGREIHLDCNDFDKVRKHIKKEHRFNLDNNAIIYGICDDCNNN